jgi:glycosyltransferase involved in cell wall biosynthesis
MARVLITTDAWHPQVNGVVRTLDTTVRYLARLGHVVEVVEPSGFWQVPVPVYPEVPCCLPRPGAVYERVRRFRPDHVHISTEGPIGILVRHYCRHRGWRFSTSYHTRFPEYGHHLLGIPLGWSYRYLRFFHNGAASLMIATPSLEADLKSRGFTAPILRWSRGVDLTLFRPQPKGDCSYPRPVQLYVGRVSKEKGLEDFLRLDTPGTKVVVGDGPARAELSAAYPNAKFLGYRKGEALAAEYAAADVFVFPSRTDTFGLVMIEAMACGVPVAAYPVTGPIDIVTHDRLGALDADLAAAVRKALATGDPAACVAEASRYTWENCTRQFVENLVPVRGERRGVSPPVNPPAPAGSPAG